MLHSAEIYTSKDQQAKFDLLVRLSDTINSTINNNRTNAIEILIDEHSLASKKKEILKKYVESRINFDSQKILIKDIEYTYGQIYLLAEELYDDKTFFGSESPYILNGLAFYHNSITFEDLILSFHNYRLGHNESDLWWLSILLCKYIYNTLSLESVIRSAIPKEHNFHDELNNLAEYVIDFWNKYLKEFDGKIYELKDDAKNIFNDKIDYDSSYYFASCDCKNESERNKFNSEYAAELMSQCTKSIYLLLITLKESNDKNFSYSIKRLRKIIENICDALYDGEDNIDKDSYGELESDIRINSQEIENKENTYENQLLKFTLKISLDGLKGLNVTEKLINRNSYLHEVAAIKSENLIEEFSKKFSEILIQSIPDNLDIYRKQLEEKLGNKYRLLPEMSLNALASAEYLYDRYVKNKAPEGFDYSGIAVLYFQAFETAYDKLLIEPYSDWLKTQRVDELYEERRNIKNKRNNKTLEEKSRLDEIEQELKSQYFAENFDIDCFYLKDKSTKKFQLVKSLEIGKFKYFIDLNSTIIDRKNQLVSYLEEECFKNKIDASTIKYFARSVGNAIEPRNEAAHGLHGLNESDAKNDKVIVYDETNIRNVLNFRNLLYSFLDFFN